MAMKLTSIFRLLITAWRRRMGQHGIVKVTFLSFGIEEALWKLVIGIILVWRNLRPKFKLESLGRLVLHGIWAPQDDWA